MGSDSAKTHEAFTVAPADPATDQPAADPIPNGTPEQLAKLQHTIDLIAGLSQHDDPGHVYEDLCWLITVADHELDQSGLQGEAKQNWHASIALAAADTIAALPDGKLQALAAAQGLAHPLLVSDDALAHWLNPAYPEDAPSKVKIQAKAAERYGQLAAGEVNSVYGHTLAELQAAEAQQPAGPSAAPGWEATPAEIAVTLAQVNQRLAELDPAGEDDGGLGALIAAERQLHSAVCPEMSQAQLDAAKASATGLIDKQLDGLPSMHRRAMIAAAVAAAGPENALDEPQARWLGSDEHLALLRASTPASVRAHLEQTAAHRAEQVAALDEALAGVEGAGGAAPSGAQAIVPWAAAWSDVREAREAVTAWSVGASDRPALIALGVTSPWAMAQDAKTRTTAWRAWAKSQPLASLRQAAGNLGLTGGKTASRAQVQNYIAAHWDSALDKQDIQQQVSAPAPATPSGKPPAPAPAATPAAAVALIGGATGGWRARHAAAVAALKAHQALAADIPARQSADEIAALTLSGGAPANAGGVHPTTLHKDQHGRSWLHKPDKTGGARAHAEAAAARLHDLAGIRTPPVYVRDVAGKTGSFQPWITGGDQLPSDPSSWSQAEVDSLVRFHVAAWMCSNHDGNPANILRTPSGGLAPIDHGQAWRYFGEDRLDASYDPNASYGNAPPAYLTAYMAAGTGKLAKGVRVRPEAALPAIKAFEQIPDAQLRKELKPVALAGVKAGLPWVERMRKTASKRLGTTAVNAADVAEEFCRQAVNRKHRLRADFAAFFSGLGLGSGGLTKVA